MINEETGVEYTKLLVVDDRFSGIVLDWAVAMADPDLPVFSMPEYTYPGNAQKLDHVLDKHAVIVDLMWDIYIEGPVHKGRWSPTTNWGHLGPYLAKHRLTIRHQMDNPVLACEAWIQDNKRTFTIGRTIEEALCRRIVLEILGHNIEVPKPLLDRHLQQLENEKLYNK